MRTRGFEKKKKKEKEEEDKKRRWGVRKNEIVNTDSKSERCRKIKETERENSNEGENKE